MNGFDTIFKVISKSHNTGQTYFHKCFKTLAGAQADIDRMIKEVTITLGWTIKDDLWRNDKDSDRVACYRFVKVLTRNDEEIWYTIEADNLYA